MGLVHDKNEDSWGIVGTDEGGILLLVCDGMGGMGHGQEASALAVKVITEMMSTGAGFPPERLRHAIRTADSQLRKELCNDQRGLPGSTAVLAYVLDGVAHVAWVGDSRAYLVRGGVVVERTRDHKLVEELVAAGQLTAEEARHSTLAHVVTRALGGRSVRDPAVSASTLDQPWKLHNGDRMVLCSDGVSDLVEDAELPGLLGAADPEQDIQRLIDTALERGGHDNITAVIGVWDGPDYVEEDAATPVVAAPRDFIPDLRLDREPWMDPDDLAEHTDPAFGGRVTEEIDISPDDAPPLPPRGELMDDEETTDTHAAPVGQQPAQHRPELDEDPEDAPPAPVRARPAPSDEVDPEDVTEPPGTAAPQVEPPGDGPAVEAPADEPPAGPEPLDADTEPALPEPPEADPMDMDDLTDVAPPRPPPGLPPVEQAASAPGGVPVWAIVLGVAVVLAVIVGLWLM